MILVGSYTSPFVRRVAVTLHLYGFSFRNLPLETRLDGDEISRWNPLGRVPVLLIDGGEALVDSGAIIDWLDERAGPGRALVAPSGIFRHQVNRRTAIAVGVCEKYVSAFYERYARPQDCVWSPWLERLEGQVRGGLRWLEASVEGRWLFGPKMTHADVAVASALMAMGGDMPHLAPRSDYPRLHNLADQAAQLPAFMATRPA